MEEENGTDAEVPSVIGRIGLGGKAFGAFCTGTGAVAISVGGGVASDFSCCGAGLGAGSMGRGAVGEGEAGTMIGMSKVDGVDGVGGG